MSAKTPGYWTELNQEVGRSWNRFWFTPSHPRLICLLRIAVGLLALAYIASFTTDLTRLFAADGLMSTGTVEAIRGHSAGQDWVNFSFLDLANTPGELWAWHLVGGLIVICFTLGAFTRVTAILSFMVVLSYMHRQPVLTGHFEPVLSMLFLYLCLGPCGACLSVDQWRASRRRSADTARTEPSACWTATLSLRLIQLHCVAFYLLMGFSKLAGDVWWEGEAVWSLMSQVRSRPLDLTFLRERSFLLEAWTHAIVAFELAFPLLIWKPLARPVLLVIAVVMWTSLAIVTGLLGFCLVMLVASAAFLPAGACRRLVSCLPGCSPSMLPA